MLVIIDYVTDYLRSLYLETSTGMNFAINHNIRHQIEECTQALFDLLLEICTDNNLAKSQIFKGDGSLHLIKLLNKQNITAGIFMLKITKEINIGSYITRAMYQAMQDVYAQCLADVVGSWEETPMNMREMGQMEPVEEPSNEINLLDKNPEKKAKFIQLNVATEKEPVEKPKGRLIVPCIKHKDFNHYPSLFLIVLNRFWDNLFKRTFLNERMRVRNMLALQEALYIPMAEKL